MLHRPKLFLRSSGISIRPVDGASVLVREEKHLYFALNRVGARIWSLLEQPQSIEDIVKVLAQEFAIGEEQCRFETERFIRQLIDRDLVETPPV